MQLTQQIRDDIREYLKRDGCNQIKGFYGIDGYWNKSIEAFKDKDEKQKALICKEVYGDMLSITEEEIEDLIVSYNTDWLRKYGKTGMSNAEKEAKRSIGNATSIAKENYKTLCRTRFFLGALCNIFDGREVRKMINQVRDEELNSTFWESEDTRLSNCVFRLNILKSYLEYSPYKNEIDEELKKVAKTRLVLNGVDKKTKIGNLSLSEINNLMNLAGD